MKFVMIAVEMRFQLLPVILRDIIYGIILFCLFLKRALKERKKRGLEILLTEVFNRT